MKFFHFMLSVFRQDMNSYRDIPMISEMARPPNNSTSPHGNKLDADLHFSSFDENARMPQLTKKIIKPTTVNISKKYNNTISILFYPDSCRAQLLVVYVISPKYNKDVNIFPLSLMQPLGY